MTTLSKSFEDYLEEIYVLEIKNKKIKSVEIAKALNVSKPAVSKAMNELLNKGYINKEPYGEISLTDSGREIAKQVYSTHITIRDFLKSLGVSDNAAEIDCCKIEHVVSNETIKAIRRSLKK